MLEKVKCGLDGLLPLSRHWGQIIGQPECPRFSFSLSLFLLSFPSQGVSYELSPSQKDYGVLDRIDPDSSWQLSPHLTSSSKDLQSKVKSNLLWPQGSELGRTRDVGLTFQPVISYGLLIVQHLERCHLQKQAREVPSHTPCAQDRNKGATAIGRQPPCSQGETQS